MADLSRVTGAALEGASVVVGGHVPLATHDIVNVLAPGGRHGAFLARTEAELAIRHKVLIAASVGR